MMMMIDETRMGYLFVLCSFYYFFYFFSLALLLFILYMEDIFFFSFLLFLADNFFFSSVESAIHCHLRKQLQRTIFNLCGRTTHHLSAQTTANDG